MFHFSPLFTDHMVLSADLPIRVYGEGDGLITVSLNGASASAQAQSGRWLVTLPAMPCGGPFRLQATDGTHTVILSDVYIGLVYLCAGQSNMQLTLSETDYPAEKYENNGLLRFFSTARLEDNEPFFPSDGWMISTRDTAARRTAIGYLMGNEISRKKNVAVGIVCCYQGASVIETWVPQGAFDAIGLGLSREEKGGNHTDDVCAAWYEDGTLYHYAFSQVVPFSFSAVVWYQGESDACCEAESRVYARELAELIRIWRRDLMNDTLPFVIIQIADYAPYPFPNAWKQIQQQQLEVMNLTHSVKTVICADICGNELIHPVEKQELSHRVACALTE